MALTTVAEEFERSGHQLNSEIRTTIPAQCSLVQPIPAHLSILSFINPSVHPPIHLSIHRWNQLL